jgi:putative transposase
MKKHEIRIEFIKLRTKQNSYSKCKKILEEKYNIKVSIRTLKRWQNTFDNGIWDYNDKSTRPNHIYYKVTLEAEKEILNLRNKFGWGALKIKEKIKSVKLSHTTINYVLKRNGLTRKEHNRAQRAKYVRFQREHSNSLWHIDDSEFGEKGKIIAVIDDCSRYCIGILHVPSVTTMVVTEFLDSLIKQFGTPREIISDNGSPYGLKSKYSVFDTWCRRRNIKHIRTKVKRPQTNGKVERLFGTIKREIVYYNNDLEEFRMNYNCYRPHLSLNQKTPNEIYNKNDW